MASKKDRTSSATGATSPAAPPAGSAAGEPGAAANGTGGAATPESSEGFNIVAARHAIPVLDRALRAWDKALTAQHTPAGFAVEFVAHLEPDRLARILCASHEEIGRLADALAAAYPSVPAADWRSALEAKRTKPREGVPHSAAGAARKRTQRAAVALPSGGAAARLRGQSPELAAGTGNGGTNSAPPTSTSPQPTFTPEQRAQYQIPPWADGTDLRSGETLERYATRKRVAGPPPDRSKFIGE